MTWNTSRFVAFDLETYLIEDGILTPRIVCGSVAEMVDYDGPGGEDLFPGEGRLLSRVDAIAEARRLLSSDSVLVGANIAFDFGCLLSAEPILLPLIFKAYEEHRVYDIQIAQALHSIAEGHLYKDPLTFKEFKGRYSLARCVDYVLGRSDAKKHDTWRKSYALLENVPIAEWPDEARQYPVDDVVNTLEVAVAQVQGGGQGPTPGPHRNLGDLSNQCETAWAMHLGAIWGLRTDRQRVADLRTRVEKQHAEFTTRFARFFKTEKGEVKKDGDAVKRAVILAYGGGGPCTKCDKGRVLSEKTGKPIKCSACSGTGLDPGQAPRTETGGVSADRETLAESGDLELAAFGDNEPEKILTTYLPKLESEELGRRLSPNVLVSSGRTSYDGLIQLLPKEGGIRECFQARGPQYVYCSVDYAALELCTLAQICLWIVGRSQMAETINAHGDPGALHTALGAAMRGWTTEEMTAALKGTDAAKKEEAKKYRQAAKCLNFGLPGGMGAAKLVVAQRKKSAGSTISVSGEEYPGIRFCILLGGAERCGVEKVTVWRDRPTPPICKACVEIVDRDLRPAWFKQWPEIKPYFDWVSVQVNRGGEFPCFKTERVRGGLDFSNGANNGFQALAADGAKNALRKLVRECYLERRSVLFGSRPIFFVHDEIIAELPEHKAHLAGPRMAEVMIEGMKAYVPDVTIRAEPCLMQHWYKSAEAVYDESGKLIPWVPKEVNRAT